MIKKLRQYSLVLPGLMGWVVLFIAWVYLGINPRAATATFITGFTQGIIFIMLPASVGLWGAWVSRKNLAGGGFLQLLVGLPGSYLWFQAFLFALFDKHDGIIETLLLMLGASLFVTGGFLALRRNKRS